MLFCTFIHDVYSDFFFFWLIRTRLLLVSQGWTCVLRQRGPCNNHRLTRTTKVALLFLGCRLQCILVQFVAFMCLCMCIILSACTGWLMYAFGDLCIPRNKHRDVSKINKTRGLALFVTSVLQRLFAEALCTFMPYLWVNMCLYAFLGVRVSSLRRLKVLWYSRVFKHVLRILQSASSPPVCGDVVTLGELAEPLTGLWHWWRGTRCETLVSAGSGCSSKPGTGWRSPRRPATSRMSRTARGPGWAGSRRF